VQYLKLICLFSIQEQSDSEPFQTTAQDLAGFWDMIVLQFEDCEEGFKEIDQLRQNHWVSNKKVMSTAFMKPSTDLIIKPVLDTFDLTFCRYIFYIIM